MRVDPERVVEGPLLGFGLRGCTDVQRAPVGAAEGGGDALLAFQDVAHRACRARYGARSNSTDEPTNRRNRRFNVSRSSGIDVTRASLTCSR